MKIKTNSFTITQMPMNDNQNELKNIYQKVYVDEQKIEKSLVFAHSSTENIKTFLLHFNNQAVSTGRVRYIHDSNLAKIERMATIAEFRGYGFAKQILLHLINQIQSEYPIYQIMLHSQKSANSFYEKLGWTKEGDEFMEANILHQKYFFSGTRTGAK
ncbi:GNAT family N-acetyltransferase [Bacteriovoracaceae bacterium]|nr:GNAT family N-acetyltransferase [Bacteriovoracaceae bacterium]